MICVFSSLIWHCVLQTRSNEFAAPLFMVQDTPLDVIVYHTGVFRQRQAQPSLERKIAREGGGPV